jgi:small subunit ribosomal protein S16
MAVKIRLARRGRRKLALYDIVIAENKAPRDGRFIEKIGNYNPHTNPASFNIKEDVTVKWLLNGAQPTNTVRNILSSQGLLLRKHLQMGVNKGAITQEEADTRWNNWWQEKQNKLQQGTASKNSVTPKITKPVIEHKEEKSTASEEKEHKAEKPAPSEDKEHKAEKPAPSEDKDSALSSEIIPTP